jgi:hypothetical protein
MGGLAGFYAAVATMQNSYTMGSLSCTGVATGNMGGAIGNYFSGSTGLSLSIVAPSSMVVGSCINAGVDGDGSATSLPNTYLYRASGSGVPADMTSGVTTYTVEADMENQSSFSGLTFGASAQNWAMPSANPLSPTGLLSPVLYWQCGSSGIVCP